MIGNKKKVGFEDGRENKGKVDKENVEDENIDDLGIDERILRRIDGRM